MASSTVNATTWSLAKAFQEVNQAVTDNAIAMQDRNAHFVQSTVMQEIEVLKSNTESARSLLKNLAEQAEKQQTALQALAYESVDAYVKFLFAPFSQYKEAVKFAQAAAK